MSLFNQLNPDFVLHIGTRPTAEKIREHFEHRVTDNRLFTCLVGRLAVATPHLYDRRLARQASGDSIGAGGEVEKSSYLERPTDVIELISFLAQQQQA